MDEVATPRAGWYVIQVVAGQEDRMCQAIQKACEEHDRTVAPSESVGLSECFTPKFRSQKKWRGTWRDVEYLLLPGYVIADVINPAKLVKAMRTVLGMCRLLTAEGAFIPLDERERMWVESQTQKGDRVVPMSFGHREGGTLTVTDGPLKGREGEIVKVDRANSMAHLEFHVGQLCIKTKVGLGILPK